MKNITKPSISIITATYNAANVLTTAINSLREQSDKDFEWVVADGGSTDGTLELLRSIKDLNCKVSSCEDFGIYDALNRAIRLSSGDYYIVIGADDLLDPLAVSLFKYYAKNHPDLIATNIRVNGVICKPGKGNRWFYGAMAYVAGHSVGMCIKRSIHDELGFYSKFYPIVADQVFILHAIDKGLSLVIASFVAGEFSTGGTSGTNYFATATDFCRAQIDTGANKYLQLLLFVIRICKNLKKISSVH